MHIRGVLIFYGPNDGCKIWRQSNNIWHTYTCIMEKINFFLENNRFIPNAFVIIIIFHVFVMHFFYLIQRSFNLQFCCYSNFFSAPLSMTCCFLWIEIDDEARCRWAIMISTFIVIRVAVCRWTLPTNQFDKFSLDNDSASTILYTDSIWAT